VRLIKLAFLSIVFLFLIITAISLLIPSHIRISKAINLGTNRGDALKMIRDTNDWQQWYPPFMPANGSIMSQIQISRQLDNDSELVYRLQQRNRMPVMNGWKVYHSSPDSLTLQWYADFHLKWYPWQKFGSLLYENTYGVIMEQGLNNLKKLSEK
jgi:hypothetical protein